MCPQKVGDVPPKSWTLIGGIFMSRKIKYDINFKLKVVHQILKNKESTVSVSDKLGISKSLIERWVHFYQIHGNAGLMPIKNQYTPEFKLGVIRALKAKSLSLSEACRLFRIPSDSTLKKWLIVYETSGVEGLRIERRGRGRPITRNPTMPRKPKRPLTREEQLLEELADLKAENAYLKKLHALIQSESEKELKRKSSKN